MSPSELGEHLKPFVFLDLFEADMRDLHQLHLGAYSVHTSEEALAAGERNIRELKERLDAAGDRRTGSGSTPVFRE